MKLGILDFFSDISNFFKGGTALGVDIGTSSIKIIELEKKGDKFSVENYGMLEKKMYLERANEAIQTSSLKIAEKETAELLSILLRDMKPKTRIASASLPLFSAFVTILELPLLSRDETQKAVMFQARQHIPIPIEKISIEWHLIDTAETSRGAQFQRLLLIGVPNEIITRYKSVFKQVGLKLVSLEVEPFALIRALKNFLTDRPIILVDIGAQSTNAAVLENKIIKILDQTDYSGIYLTQALSKSLDVSMTRAEELKKRRGLNADGPDAELSTLLLPFLDVIIQEIRHVKDVYERKYGRKVEKLMLAGGAANLAGIEKYVAKQLDLTIAHHSPFLEVEYRKELEPIAKELNNTFATALGLAKKYFSK